MEAILHYRTKGHITTKDTTEEVLSLLAKQTPMNLLDVRRNKYELDKQCDYADANPSPEPYVNFYVVTEIDHKSTDVTDVLKEVKDSNAIITQEWECGNEQYYVVQLNAAA